MATNNYYLIIAASGIGRRMHMTTAKQHIKLDNKLSVLEQTLTTFFSIKQIKGCIVATSNQDELFKKSKLYNHPKILKHVIGGKTRYCSINNALIALKSFANHNDWVITHDAVRPCIQKTAILNLINKLKEHKIGGLLANKITNTIKKTNDDNIVEKTISRTNLWQAQTPQMYRFAILLKAFKKIKKNNITITDEASAIEYLGLKTMIIANEKSNIKITTKQDLALANFYLKSYED